MDFLRGGGWVEVGGEGEHADGEGGAEETAQRVHELDELLCLSTSRLTTAMHCHFF